MNSLISVEHLTPMPLTKEILALNEISGEHGLVLTEEEARELSETRRDALVENDRIEAGAGAVPLIVRRFCASRFATKENYAYILNEITDIFYYIKTETDDGIGDEELIDELFNRFELNCRGDMDMLEAREVERLIRKINAGDRYAAWYAEDDAFEKGARETPDNLLAETREEDGEPSADDEAYESVNREMEEEERVDLDPYEDFADGNAPTDEWDDADLYDEVGEELTELEVSFDGFGAKLSVGDAYPEGFFESLHEPRADGADEEAPAPDEEDDPETYDGEDDDGFDLDALDRFFDREAHKQEDGHDGT